MNVSFSSPLHLPGTTFKHSYLSLWVLWSLISALSPSRASVYPQQLYLLNSTASFRTKLWHPGCCSVVTDSTGDGNLCVPGVPPSVLTGVPSAGPALSTPRPDGPMYRKSIKRKWTSLWSHSYYNASIKVWREMWGNLQFLHFRILPIFKDFFTLTLPSISSKWWCCPPRHLCTLFFSVHCD